jgi:UDP:flavonoid glycosyltransferase YjiC (YdhE family)
MQMVDVDSRGGFVVVSFGSITSGDKMPRQLLETFMESFASFNLTFLWQFGSTSTSVKTPPNVLLFDWFPISSLLRESIKLISRML